MFYHFSGKRLFSYQVSCYVTFTLETMLSTDSDKCAGGKYVNSKQEKD